MREEDIIEEKIIENKKNGRYCSSHGLCREEMNIYLHFLIEIASIDLALQIFSQAIA